MKFIFQAREKEIEVPAGYTVLQAAAAAGMPVEGNCGGNGTCGRCRVKLLSAGGGDLSPGWTLACRSPVAEGLVVEVPDPGDLLLRGKAGTGHWGPAAAVDSPVDKVFVQLEPPSLKDQTADLERLLTGMGKERAGVDPSVLADLPGTLRRAQFKVTATLIENNLAAVEEGDTTARKYGLAVDIGTTTLAVYLLDLNSGELLAAASCSNTQKIYGADVISRIQHAQTAEGLGQLREMALNALNGSIARLLKEQRIAATEIVEAVVVGNTTMAHLFLGIDPTHLANAPFTPAFRNSLATSAGQLGLSMHPRGRVVVLPNIAGYVGSDTVGVMLATRIHRQEGICLAVDIGTNGEVVLAGRGRILTCSTAAGPAFEGSHIRHGMRAAAGAIEAVKIDEDVSLKVIGDAAPRGICGSGLIDVVAEMLKSGLIESSGRFASPEEAGGSRNPPVWSRLRRSGEGREFVVAPGSISATGEDIVITQKDLRELQLAKGALLAGIRLLLREMGTETGSIGRIFLAGTFGNYINRESAVAIGLLPAVPPEIIVPVGNAAGEGAMLALVSREERNLAAALARKAEHLELSARMDFQEDFVEALSFPEGPGSFRSGIGN
jgi:uncharacterized 2Fe-2S/4Fe-4S cluster protein (DUF4445 family)